MIYLFVDFFVFSLSAAVVNKVTDEHIYSQIFDYLQNYFLRMNQAT